MWFPAIIFVLPIMLSIWGLYLMGIDAILGTTIFPTVAKMFFDLIFWIIGYC